MSRHRLIGEETVQLGPPPIRPGRGPAGQHRKGDTGPDAETLAAVTLLTIGLGLALILAGVLL